MDSLTHLVLGAAVGELILGRKLGNKAMLLGAIANTLPDLDVLYNLIEPDPVKNHVFHRSYTHSLLAIVLLPLLIAWLSKRWSKKPITFERWYLFWFTGMFTHVLIDCTTTYGTKIFTPFSNYQVAFNNLSIIDPLYTIPFLLLVVVGLFIRRGKPLRRKFIWVGITVSSVYLLATFFIKWNVHNKFREALQRQKIDYKELNTTPTILNGILWSAIAYNDSMIYTAEYSYLKTEVPIVWMSYKRNLSSIRNFDCKAIRKMQWFSDGNYFVQQQGRDTLAFYNVKWGRARFDENEPHKTFVFYMLFYKQNGEVRHEEVMQDWKFNEALEKLMERIGI